MVENTVHTEIDNEAVHSQIEKTAQERVKKILKKNSREIARLRRLAEQAIIDNNKDSYVYAIGKLRDIYKQPHNPKLLSAMWETTRATVLGML